MKGFIKLIPIVALTAILSVISCKKTDPVENITTGNTNIPSNNYNPPAVTFSATVQGFVTDAANNPVGGAEVKTGNKTAITDINGYFKIDNAPFTGDFCYLKASKKGFFTGSVTVHGKAGSHFAADLVLQPQQYIASFSAAQGKTVTLQGGSSVFFPANGFVTSTGAAYTGNINIAAVHLNPDDKNFSSLIPGGDLRAFDANGQNVQLFSYGMLNVEMRDDAGNLLQLAKGKKATLTMPVPQTLLANAPTTIPLWYFDDVKGIWIEEGSATLQGNNYVGTVAHFTAWNYDKPFPPSMVKGKVVDNKDNPVPYAVLVVDQRHIFADDEGNFTTTAIPESDVVIDVINELSGLKFGLNIKVKALGTEQTLDVGKVKIPEMAEITGIVKKCDGSVFTGYMQTVGRRVLITDSKISFKVPATGNKIILSFYTSDYSNFTRKEIILPTDNSEVKDLGVILTCGNTQEMNYVRFVFTRPGSPNLVVEKIAPELSEFFSVKNFPEKLKNIQFADGPFNSPDLNYKMVFAFNGVKTEYKLTSSADSTSDKDGVMFYQSFENGYNIISKNIVLKIPKFGAVGEVVTGTFSGTALKGGLEGFIDGEFKVLRTADR
ncbi:MAG: carboxypeptidase-like regulatory domain-containing protein [Bacteroidota bacterium]